MSWIDLACPAMSFLNKEQIELAKTLCSDQRMMTQGLAEKILLAAVHGAARMRNACLKCFPEKIFMVDVTWQNNRGVHYFVSCSPNSYLNTFTP
jgi:hypothetical protein